MKINEALAENSKEALLKKFCGVAFTGRLNKYMVDVSGELIAQECAKCKVFKNKCDFGSNVNTPYGLNVYCKKCLDDLKKKEEVKCSRREIAKKSYHNNKHKHTEKRKAYSSSYNKKNSKAISEYQKEYYRAEERRARKNILSREGHLRRKFNLSIKEYEIMLSGQNGKCAICGAEEGSFKIPFGVDHNHATGKIRGILCHSCNVALGLLKENLQVINNMILYINKYKC